MLGYEAVLAVLAIAGTIAFIFVLVSRYVGPHNPNPQKTSTYECGVDPIGSARNRISVSYYLIAIIFILFDLEVAFLYPWAVLMRELGVAGLIEMGLFIGILLVGFIYAWRKGALEWE